MKEFFENLKEKRLEKGISLEEIHQRTRLPLHYLQAIEEGEMEKLPHGYERIYLKRYAREIGLDVDDVLHDFDMLNGRLYQPDAMEGTPNAKSDMQVNRSMVIGEEDDSAGIDQTSHSVSLVGSLIKRFNLDRVHHFFWIGLAGAIILLIGYFTYQQYFLMKNSKLEVKEITITDLINELEKQEANVAKPSAASLAMVGSPVNENSEVLVQLVARERTWVREIRDGKDTTEYILPAGMKRNTKAAQFIKFTLGRADGVEIWLNNTNLGIMGAADEVVLSLVLNNTGIVEKRLKKVQAKIVTENTPTAPEDSSAQSQTENPPPEN